jgi:hypothetical protein
MQLGLRLFAVLSLTLSVAAMGTAVEAQSPALTHLGHVTSGFNGAPDGRGLAVTTAEEISLTMMHANFAAGDLSDLDNMKTHAGHVLHLISPAEGAQGPGLGFGVIPGLEGITRHIELAMNADGASESLRTHAAHVALAARGNAARAEQIAELARQVLAASAATEAAPLVEEFRVLALALDTGADVNGSGGLDLDGIEGGFGQLENHLYLALEGEMLPRILQ